MTHQSHTDNSRPSTRSDWMTGAMREGYNQTIDRDLIERHIAAGRKMQAAAIAAALKAPFGRLLAAKRRREKPESAPQSAPGQAIQA